MIDSRDLALTYHLAKQKQGALDAERRYIGSALYLGQRIKIDAELLRDVRHQVIARAIAEDPAEPPTLGTVADHLRKNGQLNRAGGVAYVAMLTSTELLPFLETAEEDLRDSWRRYDVARVLTGALDQITKGEAVEVVLRKLDEVLRGADRSGEVAA